MTEQPWLNEADYDAALPGLIGQVMSGDGRLLPDIDMLFVWESEPEKDQRTP